MREFVRHPRAAVCALALGVLYGSPASAQSLAMTDQRGYNTPRTTEDAVAELRRESGRQFDPRVVEAFLDTLPEG